MALSEKDKKFYFTLFKQLASARRLKRTQSKSVVEKELKNNPLLFEIAEIESSAIKAEAKEFAEYLKNH